MKKYFQMMANYNQWANTRIYSSCSKLSDTDRKKDRQAFFKSIHNTLNHLLLADRIWLHRFTKEGKTYSQLDIILYDHWETLISMRRDEDDRIICFIEQLSKTEFHADFSYCAISNPQNITQPLAIALLHFFNHQTHHRGQVHVLLSQAGVDPPSLDLILFQRESKAGNYLKK